MSGSSLQRDSFDRIRMGYLLAGQICQAEHIFLIPLTSEHLFKIIIF